VSREFGGELSWGFRILEWLPPGCVLVAGVEPMASGMELVPQQVRRLREALWRNGLPGESNPGPGGAARVGPLVLRDYSPG
jgi:hypothetical protein